MALGDFVVGLHGASTGTEVIVRERSRVRRTICASYHVELATGSGAVLSVESEDSWKRACTVEGSGCSIS
jgi:hypothetical protein